MYSLLRSGTWRNTLFNEVPSLGLSLLIAELFYKFHSFTLECLTFLATWVSIGYVFSMARRVGASAPPQKNCATN